MLGDEMRVYLCRHGEASPGEPDEERALTNAGVHGSIRLGNELAQEERPPQLVLTSTHRRAYDSAKLMAAQIGCKFEQRHELRPGADIAKLREALEGLYHLDAVAAVCHMPDCADMLYEITGADHGFHVSEAFPIELEPE